MMRNLKKIDIKKNLLSAGKILGILENDPENWLGYNQNGTENSEEIEGDDDLGEMALSKEKE